MILISHRGNLDGPNPQMENRPSYVSEALARGYQVEIDVWRGSQGGFMLGHDKPQHWVEQDFLLSNVHRLWFHCKNELAHECLWGVGGFFHTDEPRIFIDSRDAEWNHSTYKNFNSKSICVMPELVGLELKDYYNQVKGVCSDRIARIKEEYAKLTR